MAAGLVELGPEYLIAQMPQKMKKGCNFILGWLLDLDNVSLEQNLGLKTLGYLLFIPAIFCLLFCWPMANFWLLLRKQSHSLSFNHCVWVINFDPKVTGSHTARLDLYVELNA